MNGGERLDSLGDDDRQVDQFATTRRKLVAPGEQQQVIRDRGQAAGRAHVDPERVLEVGRMLTRCKGSLRGRQDDGQRRAHLVRRVGHEATLARMGLSDRLEGPGRQDPGGDRDCRDHDDIGDHERKADPLDRRLIGDGRHLFAGQVGFEVERWWQHDQEPDVEDEAEQPDHDGEQHHVQDREADPRAAEHQLLPPDRSRYPERRTVSINPSRRPSSTFRRRLRT
jgi:hypothetical protein